MDVFFQSERKVQKVRDDIKLNFDEYIDNLIDPNYQNLRESFLEGCYKNQLIKPQKILSGSILSTLNSLSYLKDGAAQYEEARKFLHQAGYYIQDLYAQISEYYTPTEDPQNPGFLLEDSSINHNPTPLTGALIEQES